MSSPSSAFSLPSTPLASSDFRLYLVADFFSTVAVQMQSLAVGWQIYALSGNPVDLGYIGLVQFVPVAMLSLFAGTAADRFDRRKILLLCIAFECLAFLLLWRLSAHPARLPLYAVLFLLGCARGCAGPSLHAFPSDLVPTQQLAKAVAWSSSAYELAVIVGPSCGGLLYGHSGHAAPVYLTCAALAFGSFLAFAWMRVRGVPSLVQEPSKKGALWAGVRYVCTNPILLGALSLDLVAVLFGGAVALLPVFARDILRTGPFGLGLLRSAPSLGAACMAVWLARGVLPRHAGRALLQSVAIFGLATVLFGLSRRLELSLLALFVIGAADMVSVVWRKTLIQVRTPKHLRGRVNAFNLVFVGASNELGEFESGLAAACVGTVPAVVAGGVLTCIVVGLWTFLFPELAKIRDLHEEQSSNASPEEMHRV